LGTSEHVVIGGEIQVFVIGFERHAVVYGMLEVSWVEDGGLVDYWVSVLADEVNLLVGQRL
jgi:hypothetical protein